MKNFLLLASVSILFLTGCETATTPPPPEETVMPAEEINAPEPIEVNSIVGIWRLQSQVLDTPAGVVTNPFAGRTLTFKEDGSYVEDYSTETTEDITVNTPEISVTSHCKVTGSVGGTYEANEEVFDLDNNISYNELIISSNREKPEVSCQTSTGGIPNISKLASMPLGTKPNVNGRSNYVYNINDEKTVLTISQENSHAGVKIIYTFTK